METSPQHPSEVIENDYDRACMPFRRPVSPLELDRFFTYLGGTLGAHITYDVHERKQTTARSAEPRGMNKLSYQDASPAPRVCSISGNGTINTVAMQDAFRMIEDRQFHGIRTLEFFITPGYSLDEMDPQYPARLDEYRAIITRYFELNECAPAPDMGCRRYYD